MSLRMVPVRHAMGAEKDGRRAQFVAETKRSMPA